MKQFDINKKKCIIIIIYKTYLPSIDNLKNIYIGLINFIKYL